MLILATQCQGYKRNLFLGFKNFLMQLFSTMLGQASVTFLKTFFIFLLITHKRQRLLTCKTILFFLQLTLNDENNNLAFCSIEYLRGVFRTQFKIYDETFCTINYFRKNSSIVDIRLYPFIRDNYIKLVSLTHSSLQIYDKT